MVRAAFLAAAALLFPLALAASVDTSPASLLETPRAVDADGSFVPDALEPHLCGVQAESDPADGTCADGVYTPPTGPIDADRDDAPDAAEPVACAAGVATPLGACEGGDLSPSGEPLVGEPTPPCDDAESCAALACDAAGAEPGCTEVVPPACEPSVTRDDEGVVVDADPLACLVALGVPACDPLEVGCDPADAKAAAADAQACAARAPHEPATMPGAVACAAADGSEALGPPGCASSDERFACANTPLGALLSTSSSALALVAGMAEAAGAPAPPLGASYDGASLTVTIAGTPASAPLPWPYELRGDGMDELGVRAGPLDARICPSAAAPDGVARELRCGGDMDGDGDPDLHEVNLLRNPLDPGADGDDALVPPLPGGP